MFAEERACRQLLNLAGYLFRGTVLTKRNQNFGSICHCYQQTTGILPIDRFVEESVFSIFFDIPMFRLQTVGAAAMSADAMCN